MTNDKKILDFESPGALDEELTYVPGFINELTGYTLSQAHSPNRTLAFLGATAMLAHLAGRSYADTHGTRTNLYLIALGETGIGKDAPRRTNRKLADTLGNTRRICDQLASGEALEELVVKTPALLFQPDEVETFAGSMRGAGKNAAGLSERVRRLYTSSGGLYATRATARNPEGKVVAYPHLTLFGTGTPTAFYNALDAASVTNGLFGRCLVLNVPDAYAANIPTDAPIGDVIIDQAKYFAAREKVIDETNVLDLLIVHETDAANKMLAESAEKLMAMRKDLSERELFTARALVVRMNEKIAKLALIYAISIDPEHPVITPDGVRWATQLVTHITREMLYEAQFHVAEGKFDALVKRFLGLLDKHDGSCDRRSLMRGLHVDPPTFLRIVQALHMCDEIIEETEFGKNPVYTLKNHE